MVIKATINFWCPVAEREVAIPIEEMAIWYGMDDGEGFTVDCSCGNPHDFQLDGMR